MNKTSRRKFTTQLAAGLATMPLLTTIREAKGQKKIEQSKRLQTKRREHDTPPPLLLTPGSLIIEASTEKRDWDTFQSGLGRRKWMIEPKPYTGGATPRDIYIAHVKIIMGSGDMIFHYDNGHSTDISENHIRITAVLNKSGAYFGDCVITTRGKHFEVDVPNNRKLKKKDNDQSTNETLRKRVRYTDNSDDDRCEWVALKIDKGRVNLLTEDLSDFDYFSDMKLMIWWENLR